MAEEWKFQYTRFGFRFTVWINRIEVAQRGMFAWKSDTLLIRNITDVGVRLGGKLRITLSDGGVREYVLGSKADAARVSILALI